MISLVEQVKGFKAYCFERTVYTVVVLTSIPEDKSITFSYAHGDFNLTDERGQVVSVYPHRMVFLAPRLVNDHTPPEIREWLEFIKDSLDGKMNEADYGAELFSAMLEQMRRTTISPEELAAIKDEAAWELAKERFAAEGRAKGQIEGRQTRGSSGGEKLFLARLLERKFGPLSTETQTRLDAADTETLLLWGERVLTATSIAALFE